MCITVPAADTAPLTACPCCSTDRLPHRSPTTLLLCCTCDGGGSTITAQGTGDGWRCCCCHTPHIDRRHGANLMYCVGCYAIILGALEWDDAA